MVRFRNGWLVVVAAASLGLGAAACGKKDDKGGGDKTADKTAAGATDNGGAGTPAAKADKPANGAIPAPSAQVSTDLGLIPADSEFVIGFNFDELRKSALWKQFEPMFMAKAAGDLAKFKDRCGFDPIEALSSVTVGAKNLGPGLIPDVTLVVHGPDKTKVLACIAKSKDEAATKGTELAIDGDFVSIKDTKDAKSPPGALLFLNDNTALMIVNATASKDTVKAAAAGTSALKTSAGFVEMFSKIDTTASLWGLANGSSKLFDSMPAIAGRPKAIFGSLDVGTGLTVDVRVRFDSPEHALQIVNMGKGQVSGLQKMVNKVILEADASDAHFAVDMSEDQLKAMVQQFSGLLGAMMMGGGRDPVAPDPSAAPAGSAVAAPAAGSAEAAPAPAAGSGSATP